jgi:hypothetical protein
MNVISSIVHYAPIRYKYFPKYFVLKYLSFVYFPWSERNDFHASTEQLEQFFLFTQHGDGCSVIMLLTGNKLHDCLFLLHAHIDLR